MKEALTRHVGAAVVAGLLLATAQVAFEAIALCWIYRGQILPPYDFLSTELYSCFTKLRHAVASPAGVRGIPEHFASSPLARLEAVPALLLLDWVTVALCSPMIGAAGALIWRGRASLVRRYVVTWTALAVAVHLASWLQLARNVSGALSLDKSGINLLNSFVLSGTVVALAVLAISCAASLPIGLFWEKARSRARRIVLAAVLAGLSTSAAWALARRDVSTASPAVPPSVATSPRLSEPLGSDRNTSWNVLLISVDSLRADHLGCYGYPRATAPAIDQLATEGTVFANAFSPTSWTLPAHMSLFTSRYQLSHGVIDDTHRLDSRVRTLGEVLREAGYSTAGFVSALYLAGHYGFDRGMESYRNTAANGEHSEGTQPLAAPTITAAAIEWLKQHQNERFFLFLHYFDVHYDYDPPPPYDTLFDPAYQGPDLRRFYDARINPNMSAEQLAHVLALYDGEIRFTDDHIGQILHTITSLGLDQRTLVVLVADHGDEFFEHGSKGHRQTLYDEVLRVPLVVRLPNREHAGQVVTPQVSLVDVMPTVLDLLDISGPIAMEGRSLAPALRGEALAPQPVYGELYFERQMNVQAMLRTGEAKIIQNFNRVLHPRRPSLEWYDLKLDAREQRNLARIDDLQRPQRDLGQLGDWLSVEWDRWRQLAGQQARVEMDSTTRERLRALGY